MIVVFGHAVMHGIYASECTWWFHIVAHIESTHTANIRLWYTPAPMSHFQVIFSDQQSLGRGCTMRHTRIFAKNSASLSVHTAPHTAPCGANSKIGNNSSNLSNMCDLMFKLHCLNLSTSLWQLTLIVIKPSKQEIPVRATANYENIYLQSCTKNQ